VTDQLAGPATIGRYRLLGRVGEGGMGIVHLAVAPDGRQVAVKILRPHVVSDDESRARLAREVESLRRVRSPRVAEVFDADPWGERPYLVTRYVDGRSLHDTVRERGPLQGDDLLRLAAGLAQAIAAVHRVGVLHRDVKPSNVLVEDRDPVLIDFGLARLVEDSRLTGTGWLLGTPGYLAPEILYGDAATTAADMHSWAATVAYAAMGRPPYGSGPAVAVMDRVRRGEHDLSGVPAYLLPVVSACLSPEPYYRPTAAEVQDWLSGPRPAAPRPPAPEPHAADPGRTRRLPVAEPRRPPAPPPAYQPVRPSVGERLLRGLGGLSLLALVTAAVVAAPLVAAAGVTALLWLSWTLSRVRDSVRRRRDRWGPRASDRWFASSVTLWHCLVAAPGALLLSALGIGAAAVTMLAMATLGSTGWQGATLAVGGLVGVGVLALCGPLSARPRRVTRDLVVAMSRPHTRAWLCIVASLVIAAGLALAAQVTGALWWPATGPP
jgi:predicted Ser/Thr protein kinase